MIHHLKRADFNIKPQGLDASNCKTRLVCQQWTSFWCMPFPMSAVTWSVTSGVRQVHHFNRSASDAPTSERVGLTFPPMHYRSHRRRTFPVNHLHWYWQPNQRKNMHKNHGYKLVLMNNVQEHAKTKQRIKDERHRALFSQCIQYLAISLQCFDTFGLAAGKASSL